MGFSRFGVPPPGGCHAVQSASVCGLKVLNSPPTERPRTLHGFEVAQRIECARLALHFKRISNPEGIESSSPGLRATSYPGCETRGRSNPERIPRTVRSRFEPRNLRSAGVFSLSSSGGEGRGEEAFPTWVNREEAFSAVS